MRRARSENAAVMALLAGILAGGCAAPYVRREPAPGGPGNQGGAWEAVLPGGETAAAQVSGDEAFRRDWVLASPPLSDLPADAWPEPYRPGLERTRRLFLPTRGGEVLYLGTEWAPPHWGRHWWWR
jgi:hypothetical protein